MRKLKKGNAKAIRKARKQIRASRLAKLFKKAVKKISKC